MECLPRLFLELCLLEEISIPHSIFRDNHDGISYLVFLLMQVSSRYNCLSLLFLSFSFFFLLMNQELLDLQFSASQFTINLESGFSG